MVGREPAGWRTGYQLWRYAAAPDRRRVAVDNPSPERAKFPRYSTPFFLHFNQDVVIEALPDCVAEGGKAQPPITAQDYLMERLREIGLVKA